tara:strand:- start:233 stop:637 length:405 start_codon:yes stop_codon:yes gene_type:complete
MLEKLRNITNSTLVTTLGIEITEFEKDCVKGRMPVDERTKQPFGLLHGGASVALAETLGSMGGGKNIDLDSHAVVGIEINASHLKSVKNVWVFGKAEPVRIGKKIQVWEIVITDEIKNLICKSRLTLAVIKKHA